MKRINLKVDLEDNEIFEEEVKKAFIDQAKQIAREEMDKELKAEIERIVTAKIKEVKESSYYNSIISGITELVVKRIDSQITINTKDINQMIEEKVNAYLDRKIEQKNGMDEFIQKYIDKSIANALLKRANEQ